MRLLLVARLTGTADRQIRIEAEDQEARDWAERRGHQIIAVAADRKWRAKGMWERPNLRSWVTDPAKIAKYDGIVAAKQDRLSRARWRDEIEIRWWAEEHRRELFIVSPELHWPPRGIAEQVTWELEAARSRAEREIISSRHQRTHPYVSDRGYLVGGPPFGYKVVTTDEHETLDLIEVEAAAIRDCVARFLGGASLQELCEQLDQMSLAPRSDSHWHSNSLSRLFRNQTLVGQVTDARGHTTLKVPPVLPPQMWERLQARLDLNAIPKGIAPESTALLTGILHCAKCARTMSRLKTGQGEFYYCRSGQDGCKNMIRLEIADGIVSDSILSFGHVEYFERRVVPGGDLLDNEAAEVGPEICELKLESLATQKGTSGGPCGTSTGRPHGGASLESARHGWQAAVVARARLRREIRVSAR
jgi:DNA invertase Pin-like site-specific DNA recombinase